MGTRRELQWTSIRCACIVLVVGCHASEPNSPTRPLVLVVSGDTEGWTVPCGCESQQSGGLPRRGSLLAQLRRDSNVVYVDVGGAPDGVAPYDRAKFEAILRGELLSGLRAHNIGAGEARLGADYLRGVKRRLEVPLVSCNVRDEVGNLIGDPIRIVTAAGRRIGLVGALSDRPRIEGVIVDSVQESVLAAIAKIADQCDSLIVMAYMPEDELMELAENLPEVDIVVGGPTHQSLVPRRVGPVLVASATNKGKFVAVFRVNRSESLVRWEGEVVELTDAFPEDPRQNANLRNFYSLLEQRDFTPAQTSFAPPVAGNTPAGVRVSGTESCVDCHAKDARVWRDSHHARAWRSLLQRDSQVDPYCQQCHTTGYGLPGGFESIRTGARRVAVGCESCHGPSRAHEKDPDLPTAWRGQARNQCRRCHDRENSPRFDYELYWKRIRHGPLPAVTPGEGERTDIPEGRNS